MYGAEYEINTDGPLSHNVADQNVPCAVCHVRERGSLLMIPARNDCPASWTKEYEGALMSEYHGFHRTMYECVDKDAESVPGSAASTNGVLLYFVEASCNGLPCPPYDPEKELLCAVCTK